MFYDPRTQAHGLPRDPMNSLVIPRPIAWVSSLDATGIVNLAPFSFYNIVSTRPPAVMFSCSGRKDTTANVEAQGEFVVNVPTYDMREAMMTTSRAVGPEVSEPELAGIEMTPSTSVRVPRVKNSKVALECQYLRTVPLEAPGPGQEGNYVIFGKVVGVHIADDILVDGFVRWPPRTVLFRLGYLDYGVVDDSFPMSVPY